MRKYSLLGLGAGIGALVRGLPSIRHAWLGGLVAVLVAAPPSLALRTQLESPDAIIKHPDEMNDQLAAHNAVDPRTFFQPFGFRSVDLSLDGVRISGAPDLKRGMKVTLALYGGHGVRPVVVEAEVIRTGPEDAALVFGRMTEVQQEQLVALIAEPAALEALETAHPERRRVVATRILERG